ncbi:ABC transporter ATP-binding protein [Mucilaginibacter ginkgonis]|uniref:ATP-binding cassette domain-containing protein n=1 Tax=Mucilaginibacter ginkgonis TaxID=2682091 RepID=A0A6I4HWB5_9SPHI|nr:ATP-binding cassette domain-containing protein [Mucilaginibacter ginkgonis]QQL51130.1 ATP-binding cassette domain-containing protein [Mucilaginibacter ginkgonis]
MIEINNLVKTYNKGLDTEVLALQDINLNISDGQFLVIVGANGSGKSTLLNAIAGSVLPTSGEILFDGQAVTKLRDFERSRWIARIFQNPLSGTAPGLSIIDNFRLAALRTKPKGLTVGIDSTFRKLVQEKVSVLGLGLENKPDALMETLSGGQRQALTLLMSTMDECKILLLDEPTAALDPRSADIVMRTADKIIQSLNLTAILVTHNLKEAFTYGNRIIQMAEGRIIKDFDQDCKQQLKQADLFEWFS